MKYYIHESLKHVYLVSGTLWAANMRVVKLYADGTSSNDDICAIEFEQELAVKKARKELGHE